MSVSSGNSNDELISAIKGGATFDERLNQMAAATASLEKAYKDLELGKAAVQAMEHARELEASAAEKYDTAIKASEDMVTKANEDAINITKKARLFAEKERRDIEAEKSILNAQYQSMISEVAEMRVEAGAQLKEASELKRSAGEVYFEAEELRTGLLRSQDAYKSELAALRTLRDKAAAMVVELHYVEVSPQKVPPVTLPVIVPAVPVVPPQGGQSMGGVDAVIKEPKTGQSMGGVDEVLKG